MFLPSSHIDAFQSAHCKLRSCTRLSGSVARTLSVLPRQPSVKNIEQEISTLKESRLRKEFTALHSPPRASAHLPKGRLGKGSSAESSPSVCPNWLFAEFEMISHGSECSGKLLNFILICFYCQRGFLSVKGEAS